MYDAFISYASEDFEFAEELYKYLHNAGLTVWFDKVRLKPGYDWYLEIEDACESSRVLLPVLTPNWGLSNWTRFETYGAEVIIPILVWGNFEDVVTPPLRRYQAFVQSLDDLSGKGLAKLVEAIHEHLAVPPANQRQKLQNLLYRHDDILFMGREQDLCRLNEMLFTTPTTLLTQGSVHAVSAMGGVGKTTLARAYAEKYWRLYDEMHWVNCQAGMEAEYARLFDTMYLDDSKKLPTRAKARRVLETFSKSTSDRMRLLILDDAVDENSISEWLPTTGSCHTIITSRYGSWSRGIGTSVVDVFDPDTSREFLIQRAGGRHLEDPELLACDTLADKLGHLPLALEQAGAFIFKQGEGFSFNDYVGRFEEQEHYYLKLQPSKGSTNYPASVYLTWRTTIDRLGSHARALLRFIAFLSTLPLPMTYLISSRKFVETLVCDKVETTGEECNENQTKPIGADEELIRSWIDELNDYSMIRRGSNDDLTVHGLLQTVVRLSIDDEDQSRWIDRVISSLHDYLPGKAYDFGNWPKWNSMLPHLQQAIFHADSNGAIDVHSGIILSMADYLRAVSQFDDAEPLVRRALESREKNLGTDHPETLLCVNTLGHLLLNKLQDGELNIQRYNNCAQEAEKNLRRVYETRKGATVRDELGVAVSAINLAGLFQVVRGREAYVEAERLLKEALAYMRDGLNAENEYILAALSNLGVLLSEMGKPEEAIEYLFEANETYERINRISDLSINTATNLAVTLKRANRLDEARTLITTTYKNAQQYLPSGHHERRRAELEYHSIVVGTSLTIEEMIEIGSAILSEKSSNVPHGIALVLNNRAIELRKSGHPYKAMELARLALQLDEKLLSPSDAKLPHRHNNLSLILYMCGDMEAAIEHNETAWDLSLSRSDLMSARSLFLRTVFASVSGADISTYVGQMKALLIKGFEIPQGLALRWDIPDVLAAIEPLIDDERMVLLNLTLDVLNGDIEVDALESVGIWSRQSRISIDVRWPALDSERKDHPAS